MSCGKRAEKVTAVGIPCMCPLCGSYACHSCLCSGMVHRLEFRSGPAFQGWTMCPEVSLTIKVTITHAIGT